MEIVILIMENIIIVAMKIIMEVIMEVALDTMQVIQWGMILKVHIEFIKLLRR